MTGLRRRAASLALLAGGLGGFSGCSLLRQESRIPIDMLTDDRACARTQAPVLLVLLPGAHMTPAELVQQGFVAALRQRGLAVDVLIPDSNLGYVYERSVMRRLHDEVIAPAQASGYRRVWLAGISLGGFLAMGYAMRHPGQIEGLLTLAPYLGRRPLVQAVAAAGPAAWRNAARPRDAQDVEHDLWMWLTDPAATRPVHFLGFGREDRFADGHQLLAGLLPEAQVQVVPGGHDWAPWQRLWSDWLDRGLLPRVCPA